MPHSVCALTVAEFLSGLVTFAWQRRIWRVDLHHSLEPDHARWREVGSRACVESMCRVHRERLALDDIAQHVSIMPDGEIWTGRDWNQTPASVGFGMNRGVFMLEMVGNFDLGADRLEGAQRDATVAVIRGVQARFRLPAEALLFHRDVPQTEKSCPGSSVVKAEMLALVRHSPIAVTPIGRAGLAALPLVSEAHEGEIRATG
jgi:hypothetical protein